MSNYKVESKKRLFSMFVVYCVGVVSFLASCQSVPTDIQKIVVAYDNTGELQKAIDHFRQHGEDQKLKALYFLVGNMSYKEHDKGEAVDSYDFLFDLLCTTPAHRKEEYELIWDSLSVAHGLDRPTTLMKVRDIGSIKASHLISHIDAAFRAWEQPWAKSLSFDEFCNYILPYKLVRERPEEWMSQAQKDYASLKITEGDSYSACLQINDEIKRRFKIRTVPSISDLSYSHLDRILSGKCYHAAQYTSYVMRSFGVPVTIDYTYWGNMNGGHEWNALIYNGKPIPFVGSESDPGKTKIDFARQRKRSKVFRHAYAVQKDEIQYLAGENIEIPRIFQNYYMQDVTKDYIPVTDVEVVTQDIHKNEYLYLCIFNRQQWIPVYWGKSDTKKVIFPDMGRSILYLPASFEDRLIMPVSVPRIVHQDGRIEEIKGDADRRVAIVVKKKSPQGPAIISGNEYELHYWQDGWVSAGKQTATADSLVYADMPVNTLLWVKSKDKASNERPFLYRNGGQEWW